MRELRQSEILKVVGGQLTDGDEPNNRRRQPPGLQEPGNGLSRWPPRKGKNKDKETQTGG